MLEQGLVSLGIFLGIFSRWICIIDSVLNINRWWYLMKDLNEEKILGSF